MSNHLKRLAMPRSWKIHRKTSKWVPKPIAGAHPIDASVPLGLALRDYLRIVDTMPEAKTVIGNREILVDGKPATSHKTPIGLMDVVSIPKLEKHYRVIIDSHGRVVLSEVAATQSTWKFCRVESKTVVSGGRLQLNLHDGRNVLVKETNFKSGDVVKLALPEQKILAHYSFGKGMTALITGGSHVGEFAKVVGDEQKTRSTRANLVPLQAGESAFATVKPYVFLVGKDKPEIALPEVNV